MAVPYPNLDGTAALTAQESDTLPVISQTTAITGLKPLLPGGASVLGTMGMRA